MTRFCFEIIDGFVFPTQHNNTQQTINNKQTYLNQLFSRLEVDIFGNVEI